MSRKAAFIFDDALWQHELREDHPMKPIRLRHTYELLDSYRAFEKLTSQLVQPRLATEEEVLLFHTEDYLEAVKCLSQGGRDCNTARFGFDPLGDNPPFPGMYSAALWSTGASITAAELVADARTNVAFNISGGLHHAMPDRASGFCTFNDPVISINNLLAKRVKVAYIDIDAHHGDGVQYAFYDTDAVLTISLHESGAFLFPGTGFVEEIGTSKGRGYSVNLPLYPYTGDDTYLWAFREVVPRLIESYHPDYVVSQLGIDAHFLDPITHLALTVQGFTSVVKVISELAPKWIALGGGGYDLGAVARAWTSAYGVMSEQELPDRIPDKYREWYGLTTLSDGEGPKLTSQQVRDARQFAEKSVHEIQRSIFPIHGIR